MSYFKKKGWTINSPAVKVGQLSQGDKMSFYFHKSAADTTSQLGDIKRTLHNQDISSGRRNYDSGFAEQSKAIHSKVAANTIVRSHVSKQLKKKGFTKGKAQVRVYHTAWTGSPAVKWKTRSGEKKKAYVRGLGI